jgi:hypothetical protein
MRTGAALLAMLSVGCADAIGLSELVYEREPTTLATGGGGAGGEGGTGGGGGEPPCEGFVFGDDFEAGEISNDWAQDAMAATLSIDAGELLLAADGDAAAFASIESVDPHNAAEGSFSVELVAGPSGDANAWAHFTLKGATGNLFIDQFDSTLRFAFQASITVNTLWQGTYDPQAHRFLRIRSTPTQRIFDASPDGSEWNEVHAQDEGTLFELVGVIIALGFNGSTSPVQVRFDNLLVCGG